MMKLLLLIATTTALIDVVVAEARSNNLQQNHRILKKDNVDWEKQDDFYWNAFAAEEKIEERKQDEFDWNAFAAELASTGTLSAQPTVSPTSTSKPSVSPTQVNYSAPLARAVVIALVTVFAFTIALIGFITVRNRASCYEGNDNVGS
jgi:hypothetical protein